MRLLTLRTHPDETVLTRFNTTSDQSSTYPLLVSIGSRSQEMQLKPSAYEVVAVFPKFLKRRHKVSDKKLADYKRQLTWATMNVALGPLHADALDGASFRYVCVVADVLHKTCSSVPLLIPCQTAGKVFHWCR